MIIKQALNWAHKRLAHSPSPTLDAEVILAFIINTSKEDILTHPEKKLSLLNIIRFYLAIKKRQRDFPVSYITGLKEFYGRDFIVNKNTLIPRPESEQIIDIVKNYYPKDSIIKILDLGTGSGCLAITLALELPKASVYASDISSRALSVAKKNSQLLNTHIVFRRGDLLEPWLTEKNDVVVANLPYVTSEEMASEKSIKREPNIALLEKDQMIPRLCKQLVEMRKPELIIIESSPVLIHQWIKDFATIFPLDNIKIISDASGKERFILIDNRQ